MIRSIAAVLAGLVVTLVLVMVLSFAAATVGGLPPGSPPTTGHLALNLVGVAVAGALGGATAMALAPHRPHGHVGVLALVILLLSLPALFSAPAPGQPAWYGLVVSFVQPLSVFVGGVVEARRRAARRRA